jgi:hypothetical protein
MAGRVREATIGGAYLRVKELKRRMREAHERLTQPELVMYIQSQAKPKQRLCE